MREKKEDNLSFFESYPAVLIHNTSTGIVFHSTPYRGVNLLQVHFHTFCFTHFQKIRYWLQSCDQLFLTLDTSSYLKIGDYGCLIDTIFIHYYRNKIGRLNCISNIPQPLYITWTLHCSLIKDMSTLHSLGPNILAGKQVSLLCLDVILLTCCLVDFSFSLFLYLWQTWDL